MTQGAILGMLASLGDLGHTTFLTKEEVERLESNLKGELEGIGAASACASKGRPSCRRCRSRRPVPPACSPAM